MLKKVFEQIAKHVTTVILVFLAMHLSLISSSLPPAPYERVAIDRAIDILSERGFTNEVFLLKGTATYRSTDNWLNSFVNDDAAYASTNFPFQIVTVYKDFFSKTVDDTERAIVLLHEARHLMGESESEAYAYVWKNRKKLGWTLRSYGLTETYATVEGHTREFAPNLFNCPSKPWEDCTE